MTLVTNYYPGGFNAQAAAQNRSEQWDSGAGTYSAWDQAGTVTAARPLNTAELADLSARDNATAIITNRAALQNKATAALANNATFLGLASPSQVQAVAQVQALTRQVNALIYLMTEVFTTTAGT